MFFVKRIEWNIFLYIIDKSVKYFIMTTLNLKCCVIKSISVYLTPAIVLINESWPKKKKTKCKYKQKLYNILLNNNIVHVKCVYI